MTRATPVRSDAAGTPALIGGALCLDFVNTLSWRGRPGDAQDRLDDYAALLDWAVAAGALAPVAARQARLEAKRRPADAALVLAQAAVLREAIARLFAGRDNAKDLAGLNKILASAPRPPALAAAKGGFAWSSAAKVRPLWRPLVAVAWSAADLLASDRRAHVRSCADPECGWMFLDTSRTHRRLWCSMADCGNRAKARRHYVKERRGTVPRT